MANGVLNPLDKAKALSLVKDFVPTLQRFQNAVSLLFNEARLRSLVERKGLTTKENFEACDEVENMRGLELEGEIGSLSFTLCDPLLFLDPKLGPEDWEELDIPLSSGPTLMLTGSHYHGDFTLTLLYDVHGAAWKLLIERAKLDPFTYENDPRLSEEDNAAYKHDIEHLWEQFQRLEIPDNMYEQKSNGHMECEMVIDEARARTLVPIFYDICDAYFDFDSPSD